MKQKFKEKFGCYKTLVYFCGSFSWKAQVAELVDALVSNTSSFGSAGSTPALGTLRF